MDPTASDDRVVFLSEYEAQVQVSQDLAQECHDLQQSHRALSQAVGAYLSWVAKRDPAIQKRLTKVLLDEWISRTDGLKEAMERYGYAD